MNNYLVLGKFKIKYNTLFIVLLVLFAFVYEYHQILGTRPMSIHQWRSCVSASIAQEYYYDGTFLPSKIGAFAAEDKTSDEFVIEFPVFYYLVSIFYRIFGNHEFIFRLLNVILGFIGLLYLFKASKLLVKNNIILNLFVGIILFISPLYVFYLNNFLPETTSLSIALIAFYFFTKFYIHKEYKFFLYSMMFFTLAGLLKVTALLLFFGILAYFLLEIVLRISGQKEEKVFDKPFKYVLTFLGVLIVVASWYAYARFYSDTHGAILSAVEVRPIWDCEQDTIDRVWAQLNQRFKTGNYYSPVFLYIGIALLLSNIVFVKKYNRFLNVLVAVLLFEVLAFNVLFFFSVGRCDYYQLNNIILPVILYLNFIVFLQNNYKKIYSSIYLKIGIIVFGIFLLNECRFFMNKQRYGGYWYNSTISSVEKFGYIEPYLRSVGIDRNDLVYVTPDVSTNINLYLMNQKGYTDFGLTESRKVNIELLIPKGLKYFIVGDTAIYQEDLSPYLDNKIGHFNGVDIYKLPEN